MTGQTLGAGECGEEHNHISAQLYVVPERGFLILC